MKYSVIQKLGILLLMGFSFWAGHCSDSGDDQSSDEDSETSTETGDTDTDSDVDTEADTESDTDSDTDTTTDPTEQTGAPVFSHDSGTYNSILEIVITCSNPGASIFYTLDGSKPTENSSPFDMNFPIKVLSSVQIKAIAVEHGLLDSEVSVADYAIEGLKEITLTANLPIKGCSEPGSMQIEGDYAYIGCHNGDIPYSPDGGGVVIIDKSNPDSPEIAGSYIEPGLLPWGIGYADDYVYLGNDYAGVIIFDVSDVSNPEVDSNYSTVHSLGIHVGGNRLYVNTFDPSGLRIFDISTPGTMSPLESWYIGGIIPPASQDSDYTYGINVVDSGNASYFHSLAVFDITDMSEPVQTGTYDVPGQNSEEGICGIVVHDNYVFIERAGAGIEIIDVSDKSNPTFVMELVSTGGGMAIFDDLLFINNGFNLYIYDITDPTSPLWIGINPSAIESSKMRVDANYIYLIYHNSGFAMYSYE